jgi:hypothetical protein
MMMSFQKLPTSITFGLTSFFLSFLLHQELKITQRVYQYHLFRKLLPFVLGNVLQVTPTDFPPVSVTPLDIASIIP